MQTLAGPVARILLRYLAGALLGSALADKLLADPDVVTLLTAAVSFILMIGTEIAYKIAKKKGWNL